MDECKSETIKKESFSKEIKEELTSLEYSKEVATSILSSFLRCNGELILSKNEERIIIKTENAKIAKFIYKLLKEVFNENNIKLSFSYRKNMRFNKSYEYIINILSAIDEVISKLSIFNLDDKIPYLLTNSEKKVRGYIVGLFLVSGSCSNPKSSNYHFEMYTHDEKYSKNILSLIKNKIKVYPFDFKMIKRRNNYVIYLKRSDQIASFLAYMDANQSSLIYEGYRLDRDVANNVNRQENLDIYNYKKVIKNSEELINIINLIDRKLGIKNINNEKLRELCYLRKDYPESSYNDLALLLSEKLNKPISKSNVNHLVIKIREMGEKFKD